MEAVEFKQFVDRLVLALRERASPEGDPPSFYRNENREDAGPETIFRFRGHEVAICDDCLRFANPVKVAAGLWPDHECCHGLNTSTSEPYIPSTSTQQPESAYKGPWFTSTSTSEPYIPSTSTQQPESAYKGFDDHVEDAAHGEFQSKPASRKFFKCCEAKIKEDNEGLYLDFSEIDPKAISPVTILTGVFKLNDLFQESNLLISMLSMPISKARIRFASASELKVGEIVYCKYEHPVPIHASELKHRNHAEDPDEINLRLTQFRLRHEQCIALAERVGDDLELLGLPRDHIEAYIEDGEVTFTRGERQFTVFEVEAKDFPVVPLIGLLLDLDDDGQASIEKTISEKTAAGPDPVLSRCPRCGEQTNHVPGGMWCRG